VAVVGLTAGPVRGAYGLSLAPDWPLSEVEGDLPQGIVLPGGVQGTRRFAADPRVHNLLRRVTGHGGYVLALDTAYMVVRSAGILDARGPRSNGGPGEGPAEGAISGWDSENALLVAADHAPSQRVLLESQVVFGRDSGAAQEAALTLAWLLERGGSGP
jgi:hypothetical protein